MGRREVKGRFSFEWSGEGGWTRNTNVFCINGKTTGLGVHAAVVEPAARGVQQFLDGGFVNRGNARARGRTRGKESAPPLPPLPRPS
jgi:hypothetical protein